MGGRRLISLSSLLRFRSADPVSAKLNNLRFFSASSEQAGKSSLRRRAIPILLLSLSGGFALSAINDIAIFHGCSKKAIEKATENQNIIEVLGTPIVRGSWYDASLAVGRRRNWVSCTFPVFGPQGSGMIQLKAVRGGEDRWWSFMRHDEWELAVLELHLHAAPATDAEKENVVRISLIDDNVTASNTIND